MEQAHWTKMPVPNDLKTSLRRLDGTVHREIAKCSVLSCILLSAVKAASAEVGPAEKSKCVTRRLKVFLIEFPNVVLFSNNVGGCST